ncbi:MAG: DUF7168 domain-containing protein [Sciscionella sp.]
MLNNATQKILDRLRLLIAHEKSARNIGSIPEAEAFAARIQAIMNEHKLGMSDVDFAEREAGEPIGWEHVSDADPDFPYRTSRRQWQVRLANTIAVINGCQAVLASRNGNALSFIGRTSDRELCKVLFIYLLRLADDLSDLCARQDEGQLKFKYVNNLRPWEDWNINEFRKILRKYKDSWFEGYSEAIKSRLYQQYNDMKTQAKASGSLAIVHIDKDAAALRLYIRTSCRLRHTSAGRREGHRNEDGYQRGKQTGGSVNLSPNTFAGTTGRTSRLLN